MIAYSRLGLAGFGFFVCVGACGGDTTGAGRPPITTADASTFKACSVDSECGVGEIDHEISSRADCLCLYGCPFVVLSKATIARRQSQYNALCVPGKGPTGQSCGIDDCVVPPTPACVAGECRFAADASH
jgi:hypothetical protein